MNKVIKRIFDVIFISIILVLASYFILRAFNFVEVYHVQTGSMEDNIHAGDYVLIIRKDKYEIGDVVTYKKDNYLVTHRIIKKANGLIVTKGDANNQEDGPIKYEQIVGKVIIIGGLLNGIIKYKYMLASIFISLYLLSSYFLGAEEESEITTKDNEVKEDVVKEISTESKEEEIKITPEETKQEEKDNKPIEKKTTTKKSTTKKTSTKKVVKKEEKPTNNQKTTNSKKTTPNKKATNNSKKTTGTKKTSSNKKKTTKKSTTSKNTSGTKKKTNTQKNK